jgi:hypothetical protein
MEHSFTPNIKAILKKHFGKKAGDIFDRSQLLQYINEKTRSVDKGSKARSSFANLYAIYVLVDDYIEKGYHKDGNYSIYDGAEYNKIFTRQRQLPFGSKLQNHALNNRMNSEFQKFFPNAGFIPILRSLDTNRYWINENLLKLKIGKNSFNIALTVIEIIDEYAATKQGAFIKFVKSGEELRQLESSNPEKIIEFISNLLAPNIDVRLFEIVSYSILKFYYHNQTIIWGFDMDNLNKESLKLYKTGRTNANDGGIDFVMRPLGRFFQVTETLDFKKYFLDIDKIQKYPLSFVIKSNEEESLLLEKIKSNANKIYSVKAIVDQYMQCIEEVINIPTLNKRFEETVKSGYLSNILDEIINQSKTEFNQGNIEEIDDEID